MKTEAKNFKKLRLYLKKNFKKCCNMDDLYFLAEEYEEKSKIDYSDYWIHQLTEDIADRYKRFLTD